MASVAIYILPSPGAASPPPRVHATVAPRAKPEARSSVAGRFPARGSASTRPLECSVLGILRLSYLPPSKLCIVSHFQHKVGTQCVFAELFSE